MKARLIGLISVLGAASMATLAAGCTGSECGDGTVERDGKCVPRSSVTCGEGTVLDEAGDCVPSEDACAEGATFDPGTGRCVADRGDCPTGTVAMGDECIPDGSVICADGTEFDAETGTCVPGAGACGEGTVMVDGECIGLDEALSPEVFSAAEPDDPAFDGTPQVVTPPAIDAERTIGGCITPEDFDGDDVVDVDIDYFAFTTSSPGMFRVRADGLGGAAAAFAVIPLDEPLASQGFLRIGLNLTGDTSERRVYLPSAGTYALLVFDSRSVDLGGLDTGLGFARAVGSEDTCYHVTMEGLEVPEPTAASDMTADGTFGDPTFLSLTASGDTVFQSLVSEEAMAVTPAQVLVVGDTAVSAPSIGFSPPVADGEDLVVVVDHVYDIGLDESEWTLDVTAVPDVPEEGDVTLTHDAEDGLGHFLSFQATAGDVVHLTVDGGADELIVIVRGPDTGQVSVPCGSGLFGGVNPCSTAETWYVVEQSGTQLVQIYNDDGVDGTDYTVSFDRSGQTPPDLTAGDSADVTLVDGRAFARLEGSSTRWGTVLLSSLAGTGFTAADVRLLADGTGELPSSALAEMDGVTDRFERIFGPSGDTFLLEVTDPDGFDGDEQLTVGLVETAHAMLDVSPSAAVSRSGDTSPPGGMKRYLLEGEAGGLTTIHVTGRGGSDPRIMLLGPDATAEETIDVTGDDGEESLTTVVGAEGWLAFAVVGAGGGRSFDLDITQAEPVSYAIGSGPSTFEDVCDMSGAEDLLDADDAVSSSWDFSTGFSYFGAEVHGIVASSNGWMTVDRDYAGTGYVGTSVFSGDLPAAGSPVDGVIAPFARDLVSTVCAVELSDRVVVQWEGTPYSGSGAIEMQAVLWDDGRIEFVYGSGHTLEDSSAVVGLEGPTGILSAIPTDAPVADSAILFTPM